MKTDSGKILDMPHGLLGKWAAGLTVFYIIVSILVALSVLPFSGFLMTVSFLFRISSQVGI
jgi:hypothetical protein